MKDQNQPKADENNQPRVVSLAKDINKSIHSGTNYKEPSEKEASYDNIEDKDARKLLSAHKIAEIIRDIKFYKLRPNCEQFIKYLQSLNQLTYVCIFLICISIIFARQKWCSDLGNNIDFKCEKSLMPND